MAEVFTRARSLLNDDSASIWNDTRLLPHSVNGYIRVFTEISKHSTVESRKVSAGLVYVAGTSDISSILPADLYQPEKLEWRLNTSEEWQNVDRRIVVPTNETSGNQADRVVYWDWQGRTIITNKATQGGLLQLTYLGLIADPTGGSSAILLDNVVDVLAYFTAMEASGRRGQVGQMDVWARLGASQLDNLVSLIILNEQNIVRRGVGFSARR